MKYNFDFRPDLIYRVFRADDYSFVEIYFSNNSVTKRYFNNKNEFNEYIKELSDYCIKHKFSIRVRTYDERD